MIWRIIAFTIFFSLQIIHHVSGEMVARCPEGWKHKPFSAQCYLIHAYGTERNFGQARTYCQAHGGDLIHIESEDLANWVEEEAAATGLVGEDSLMWVGAKLIDGEFKWVENNHKVDESILPFDGSGIGACASLTTQGTLMKTNCSTPLRFICHRSINIPPKCDYENGWEEFYKHCFKRSSAKDSWHNAQIDCKVGGGNLATLESDQDQLLATDFARDSHSEIWIGLTEENHKGEFKWISGSKSNYSKWAPDQPDLSFGGYGAVLVDHNSGTGEWMVDIMTTDNHYLCRSQQGACVFGWTKFKESCYYFNTEASDVLVWQDAREQCTAIGADLVILDDPEEDAYFRNHIPESDTIWLGLYSIPSKALYWVDNTTMDSRNFTYMSDENIEDALGAETNMCAYFNIKESESNSLESSWIPINCEEPRHYACEVPAGDPIHYVPPKDERYCPDGWMKKNDYCYYFGENELTWTQARAECNKLDADLVSIITWSEQDLVHNNIAGDSSWIGFNDRAQEQDWVWSDGASTTITNWNDGEPNDDSQSRENCGQMYIESGKWNDNPCSEERTYTCKRKASQSPFGPTTTTTEKPDYSNCGWDWTENPVTGECYRLEMYEMSYEDAHQHCHELGTGSDDHHATLVSLTTSQEQSFVEKMVSDQHLGQASVWIGLKNDYESIRWLDETPLSFFHWESGEPNSYGAETCIEMYTGSGTWNDQSCGNRIPFVCEKKGPNYYPIEPPPAPQVQCPDGWQYFNNHCYYISSNKVTWDNANSWCQKNMDSQLVSIQNADENQYLADIASYRYENFWLGLHDDNEGALWHWIDGSAYDQYQNWMPGEPNNAEGKEHCGQMKGDDYYNVGMWNDIPCSDNYYFACKITVKTCPQGWQLYNNKCYFASDIEEPYDVARNRCKEFNTEADLVSIHSDEENVYFGDVLTHQSQGTWIGYTYNNKSEKWSWDDGQTNDYDHWNEGEPNFLDSEWCTETIDNAGGDTHVFWNNLPCNNARAYGCEFFPTHTVGCEDGWEEFGDYCYWYSNADYMYIFEYFNEARDDCRNKGGDLVSIHSREEADFVFSLLAYEAYGTWIGITDDGHENDYAWTDQTSVSFTDWTQISYSLEGFYPRCGYLDYYASWNMDGCDTVSRFYICKKPKEAIPIDPVDTGCNTGDIYYEASCYTFADYSASWNDAAVACQGVNNGHLITINDKFESAYVSAYLGEIGERIWIGMNGTIADDGSVTFGWITGEEVSYEQWSKYEPNPEHGTCVSASGYSELPGFWAVLDCSDTEKYMCEYDRTGYDPTKPTTTEPPGVYCDYGFEHSGDSCYKVFTDPMPWAMAEQYCQSLTAHLTSINSVQEEKRIKELNGMSQLNATYLTIWVGLRLGSESGYEWVDGSALGYVNWAEGEPDSQHEEETCGSVAKSTFKWSVSNCQGYLPFICEAHQGTMKTTVQPPTDVPIEKCSDDSSWYKYDNYCYKFISESDEDPQPWWTAHKKCRDEGAELASIHSKEENYWIDRIMKGMSDKSLWIGGHADVDSGYKWMDGTAFDYDNWAHGEPNSYLESEDCIGLYTHEVGNWNDRNCAHLSGRICKREFGVTFPPAPTTVVPDGNCPGGWIHIGTKCLKHFPNMTTFDEGRAACKGLHSGADLVSIHSKKEQANVMALLGLVNEDAWIGFRNIEGFVWTDQSSVTYTNWAPGEPNGAQSGENCVEALITTGMWNDKTCDSKNGYICQMTQDPDISDDNPPPRCDAPYGNYLSYADACYKVGDQSKSWQDAEKACEAEGAHLASAHDANENALLWSLIQEKGYADTWIGLNNLEDAKLFQWIDGWPTFYTNWGGNEPNDSLTDHNCVRVNDDNGEWFSVKCDEKLPYLCKYEDGPVPTADPPVTGSCPDNDKWLDLHGGHCYLIEASRKSWTDAQQKCFDEGADLASIHSEDEMGLILKAIKSYRVRFWIGLVWKGQDFAWSDNTALDFINWDDGEPSSEDEKCGEVSPDEGSWNDAHCVDSRNFICKIAKKPIHGPTDPTGPYHGSTPQPHNYGSLSGGAIFGIIAAVLVMVAAVGYVGFSFISKKKGDTKPLLGSGYTSSSNTVSMDADFQATDA